jgi:hypothetical protein
VGKRLPFDGTRRLPFLKRHMIGALPARLKLPSQAEEIIISSTQQVFELWYAVGRDNAKYKRTASTRKLAVGRVTGSTASSRLQIGLTRTNLEYNASTTSTSSPCSPISP